MKRLIIAEKPDMARAFASFLFKNQSIQKQKHAIVSGDTTITWAFGHMLKNSEPGDYGEEFKHWNTYPIFPATWKLRIAPNCKDQFNAIKELLKNTDEVIHAGDPDREGQLLIDEILHYCHYQGPVKRMLANAKDEVSLKRAFENIEDNQKYYNLYQSGLCRSKADWLIGMNLTRCYTHASKRAGYQETFKIGRVKTPTLALIVNREKEIRNFKAVKHYTLQAVLEKDNLSFVAHHVMSPELQDALTPEGYLTDRTLLDGLMLKLVNQPATVTIANYTNGTTAPPLPHSLDTLQVEANKLYNISPKDVLATVQSLYEKAFVSYPRSDCHYIPTSQHKDAEFIIPKVAELLQLPKLTNEVNYTLQSKAFNDKKVTAHHAIIPTSQLPTDLSDKEMKIYRLIALRYAIQFLSPEAWQRVDYQVVISGELFKGSGKKIVNPGFKGVYQFHEEEAGEDEADEKILPNLQVNDVVNNKMIQIKDSTTTPPKRFTEGTLIKAMANIYQFIDKQDPLREKLKELKGIGTPATRDEIIAELLATEIKGRACTPFLVKNKKNELIPTSWGEQFIGIMDKQLITPTSTAIMENYLAAVEAGSQTPNEYLRILQDLIQDIIHKVQSQSFPSPLQQMGGKELIHCPICKEGVLLKKKAKTEERYFYICSNDACVHPKTDKKVFYRADKEGPIIYHCPDCHDVCIAMIGQYGEYFRCPSCNKNINPNKNKKDNKNNNK